MNICIDIGNTKAKIGFFSNNELLEVKQNITDRGIIKIIKAHNPEHVVISSVRKGIGKIVESCSKTADTIVFDHLTPVPVKSLYKTPQTLGVDRIAAVVGAALLYKHQNCLIIDMGTCITYDLIDKSATYHGGGISPGVDMRMKAMHKFTSRLPVIAAKGQPKLIGKTTKECMLSGAIIGTQAELEGIINRYKQFFDDLAIIFCGGDANFFETKIKDHIFAIPNLVLIGLNQILRFNLND
ncbi:MAG: type III pantothenate kinase [Cyclobacteriaceae bacterium]|nr:type III pantothenate kinase [Cyclobacteriaceae bacterium]